MRGNGFSPVALPNGAYNGQTPSKPPGIVMNGPVDILLQAPRPGQPASPVIIRPRTPGMPPVSVISSPISTPMRAPMLAASIPTASANSAWFPSLPPIPPPYLLAPNLYQQQLLTPLLPPQSLPQVSPVSNASANANAQANAMANAINNPMSNPQPPATPMPPVQTPPPPPVTAPPPPPPRQPASHYYARQKPTDPQPETAKKSEPSPSPDKVDTSKALSNSAFSNVIIHSLNQRLNDLSPQVRIDAAMNFYQIVNSNPELSEDPTYKPYVDAFTIKILKDPDPLVREAALLLLQLNRIPHPSQGVIHQLDQLLDKNGLYGVEPPVVQTILANLGVSASLPASHGENLVHRNAGQLDITSTGETPILVQTAMPVADTLVKHTQATPPKSKATSKPSPTEHPPAHHSGGEA